MIPRRVAVIGARGQLGSQIATTFLAAGDDVLPLARPEFDITEPAHMRLVIAWKPDVVVNAAAWTDVDGCARNPARAIAVNGNAAGSLARAAAEAGALVLQISTNEVFDGELDRPYVEDDVPDPVNPYGASKLLGERLVAELAPRHLIVRTAWLYGGPVSFPKKIRAAAERMREEGRPLQVVADEVGNPTHIVWLATALRRLLDAGANAGIWHLAGVPPASRFAWAQAILAGMNIPVEPIEAREYPRPSQVPRRAVLDVRRAAGAGLLDGADWRLRPG